MDNQDFCLKWSKHSNLTFVANPVNHINVGLFPSEFIRLNADEHSFGYVCTPSMYMLQIISTSLKSSINFSISKEDFGGYKVNGSWNGILALIDQKLADVILQFFSFQGNRNTIVDFGQYYPSEKLISILSSPLYTPENVLNIFFTFTPDIWILLLSSIITISLINAFAYKSNVKRFHIFVDYFGALLGQSAIMNRNHIKALATVWLMSTLLIRNFFTSDIQALLLSKREILLDSLDQIAEDKRIIPMIEANSTVFRIVVEEYPSLTQRLVKIEHRDPYRTAILNKLQCKSHVYVGSQFVIEQIIHHYRNYRWHEASDSKYSAIGDFPVRKSLNGSVKQKLFRIFRTLIQCGIHGRNSKNQMSYFHFLDDLQNKGSADRRAAALDEADESRFDVVLKLRSLLVCYVLLAFGCVSACVALAIECAVKRVYAINSVGVVRVNSL